MAKTTKPVKKNGPTEWLKKITWDDQGLVPVIAQDASSDDVLMFAWMNRESLQLTVERGEAVYWSRSRRKLWHKGEESGHTQKIIEIRLDCDGDTLLLKVEQAGNIACHTGHHSCFYQQLKDKLWEETEPALKSAGEIYGSKA